MERWLKDGHDNHHVHVLWSFPFWGKIKLIIGSFHTNVYNLKNLKCSEIHVSCPIPPQTLNLM